MKKKIYTSPTIQVLELDLEELLQAFGNGSKSQADADAKTNEFFYFMDEEEDW